MKRLILLSILLLASWCHATIALVQHPANTACGTSVTTCAVTTSALGTGNLLVATAYIPSTTVTISSVSGGGIWTHCPSCHGTDATAVLGVDASYNQWSQSGATTVTVTFSAATTGAKVEVLEYSGGDLFMFDQSANRDQSTAVTNPAGATLPNLLGTNDVIVQFIASAGTVSAISGSFTNPADFSGGQGNAGWINTTTITAPTWTTTSGRAALGAIAFQEQTSVPSRPLSGMETIPTLVQAVFNINTNTVTMLTPGKSGDTIIVTWHSVAVPSGVTIADSLGTSFTNICTFTSRGSGYIQYAWIGSLSADVLDSITVSSTGSTGTLTQVAEFSNLSTTQDGACTTANNNFVAHVANIPSFTTADYREMLFNIVDCNGTDIVGPGVGHSEQPILNQTTNVASYLQYTLAGNPGAYSSSLADSNNTTCSELVMAIKSATSLTVTTQSIPNALQGSSYNFQMGAVGGGGTNTWTITAGALPAGLSLSSGGNINGTCTNSNPNTITFQVADSGSAHTATKNLTLNCASGVNTTTFVQKVVGTGSSLLMTTVNSGDVEVVTVYVQNNFQINPPTDTRGTLFTVLPGMNAGSTQTQATYVVTYWGILPSGGANTITFNGVGGGTKTVSEYSNVDAFLDTLVTSVAYGSGGTTITSNAITSPVAETLYSCADNGLTASTLSLNSPFTNLQSTSTVTQNGYAIGQAAGSETSSYTVGAAAGQWFVNLMGMRPSATGTAPTGVRHRVIETKLNLPERLSQ